MNPPKNVTFGEAQERVKNFLEGQGRDWTHVDNRFYLFAHMSEEMGELARHIIAEEFKLNLDRNAKEPMPREKVISLIKDDLGDLLYHILKFAIVYDVDLAEASKKQCRTLRKGIANNGKSRVDLRNNDNWNV